MRVRAGDDKAEAKGQRGASDGSQRDAATEVRALLGRIAEATQELSSALDRVRRTQQVGEVPEPALRLLDRALPQMTLADVMIACEAFATVTGPSALANSNLAHMRTEGERLLQILQTLRKIPHKYYPVGATVQVPALQTYALVTDPHVQAILGQLVEMFTRVATQADEQRARTRFTLRLGTRFLVPGSVVASTLVIILFLMGGIGFASGAIGFSSNGLTVTNPLTTPVPTATTASSRRPTPGASATATATSGSQPTPTRNPTPTASPLPPGTPVLNVSPPQVNPCYQQQPDPQITITYSSGTGAVTWSATPADTSNIALSRDDTTFSGSVSGTLSPGQSAIVYVRLMTDTTSVNGPITVAGSSGAGPQTVMYDTSSC